MELSQGVDSGKDKEMVSGYSLWHQQLWGH